MSVNVFLLSLLALQGALDEAPGEVNDSVTLQTVVVTATRTPKTLADVPIITRVITAADITAADATDIRDLLQQELPGIEFTFSMSQQVNLNMSGFGGNDVLFLVDGERMAGETLNNIDYSRLNMDNVERIEIVKGAASSLYGSNAVGGVVNIITKKASKPWSANVNGRWGKYGEQRYGATIGASGGHWNSITNAQYTNINTVNLKNDGDYNQIYGNHTCNFKEKLIYSLSDRLSVTARAGYFFRERDASQTDKDRYRDFSGGIKGNWTIGGNDNMEVAYSFDQYDKSDYYPLSDRDIRDYSNVQNTVRALYNHSFSKSYVLTAGGDFMRDYLMSYQFTDNGSHHQESADAFAQFDLNPLERINIIGGLRYDYFSGADMSHLSSKIGLMYKLDHLTLRGAYAGGFRAPTLKEMFMNFNMANVFMIYGNSDLKSETSNNFQLSGEYRRRQYDFQLAAFHNIIENRITTVWNTALNGMEYVNMSHVTVYGVSADASARWSNGIGARLSYAFNKERIRKGAPELSSTRPHSLTTRLSYNHGREKYGFNIALSGRWLSPLDADEYTSSTSYEETQRVHYDGYSIWKLTFIQRIGKAVNITLTADNLFNYVPRYYYNNSPTTTGISFSAGMSMDIDNFF